MRNFKPLYYFYQIYKLAVYIPMLAISTAVLTTIMVIATLVIGQKAGTFFGKLWARFNAYMAPMLLTVEGKENIVPKQSYIVVANHQSQFDIFAIYGWLPLDFRWVMKMELRQVPFLGYFCYVAGHVFIDRSNHESSVKSIHEAKERIKNGISIVFFPEGTRSTSGEMLPFKKGAFKFALDTGLPILPVTIIGTREILPSNTLSLYPGKARMIIHPQIEVKKYNDDNIEDLMKKVKNILEKDLKERTP